MKKTPRPHQAEAVQAILREIKAGNTPYVNLPTGCHEKGYLVMMADGTNKAIENIVAGDYVMGVSGQRRKVLELHQGQDEMYKITPIKGDSFIVNGGHLLHLYISRSGYRFPSQEPYTIDISVRDYLKESKRFKHKAKLVSEKVLFEKKDVVIDPWLLGFMIGDGTLAKPPSSKSYLMSLTICNLDSEIKESVLEQFDKFGVNLSLKDNGKTGCKDYYISNNGVRGNKLLQSIQDLSLDCKAAFKHVPDIYKYNSAEVQNDILSGLIDSDGHLHCGGYDWISKSEQLADDVVFLAKCLGLSAYKKECIKSCQNNFSGNYYRVNIYGNTEILNLRSSRKKAEPRKQIKNNLVQGFNVESVGIGEYFGFTLDGDNLYLGSDFIVHHNSGKALCTAMLAEKCLKQGGRTLILVPQSELAVQNFQTCYEFIDDKSAIGICSAKLNKFQTQRRIVIATYTSFLKRRTSSGKFNLVVCDEAHLVSSKADSSYQKIFRSLRRIYPQLKLCGLTASPYRNTGMLEDKTIDGDPTFNICAYEANIGELIKLGYLSEIVSISGDIQIDLNGVAMSGLDYSAEAVGVKFNQICNDAVADMRVKFEHYDIDTAIVFASTIANSERIMDEWGDSSTMRMVYGDMPQSERNAALKWLKTGHGRRIIVNVGILTTGFDYQALQCVVMMRATKSIVLYLQCAGRAIRSHNDKQFAYFLDYGDHAGRLGPLNDIERPKTKKKKGDAPKKSCILCGTLNILTAKFCINPDCKAQFIQTDETGLYQMRSQAEILKIKRESKITTHKILSYEPEKCVTAKGKPYVKLKFYDYGSGRLIHNEFLWLSDAGRFSSQAESMVRFLYKDVNDFFELGDDALDADLFCQLFIDNNEFFRKCKELKLEPQEGSKYKKLVPGSIVFE